MSYQHTQTGLLGPVVFGPLAVIFLFIVIRAGGGVLPVLGLFVFFGLVGVVLVNFSRLTTMIEGDRLNLAFGRGWPRREIDLSEVVNVQTVRNLWWYGFGIRATPNGMLYNVWGLDAVELRLTSGKALRIGSDESQALADAITAVLKVDDS